MAPFDSKYLTALFDGISNFCSIAHHLRDIYKSKCQNLDLENEGQCQGVEKLDLCHSTRKFESICDFLLEF